jgi:prephenate dehydrogenase
MNIGIIGLGLIGGSLGRAIKEKTKHKVFGFDINSAAMEKAELLNAVDGRISFGDCEKNGDRTDLLQADDRQPSNVNSENNKERADLLRAGDKRFFDMPSEINQTSEKSFGGNGNSENNQAVEKTLGDLDILIYAVTPKHFVGGNGIRRVVGALKKGAVVLDAAGTKSAITAEMKRLSESYPEVEFVAAHPMAGKELSGIEYSSPSLFERASVLLVPVDAELETLALVKRFFLEIGFGYVRFTTAEEHDRIIAYTSQLPHVVSSCYIGSPTAEFHSAFSAGSFRDLSRVARMSAEMWTELFTENRVNLLFELDGMISRLNEIRDLLAAGNTENLKAILQQNSDKKETIDKADRAWKKKNKA